MLEERLDSRLQDPEDIGGLAERWKMNRQEKEALAFETIADQIEAGQLKIRGVKKADVVERLQTRANGCREGTDRHRKRSLRSAQ